MNIHKNIYRVVFLFVLVLYLPKIAFANNSQVITTTFTQSELVYKTIDSYDLVEIKDIDLAVNGKPGTPLLPAAYIRVAVPLTAAFKSLNVSSVETESLAGSYTLYPTQVPTRFDEMPSLTLPDPAFYNLSTKYPETVIEYVEAGVLGGFKFFMFRLNPLQYIPADKELWLNKSISFTFSYEQTLAPPEVPPANEQIQNIFKDLVVNPDVVSTMNSLSAPQLATGVPAIDYLIITSSALAPAYEALRNWKNQKGIATEIMTTEFIDAHYSGIDLQERIRNAIKDYWLNNGTLYVLLGGDDTVVPDRDCQVSVGISYIEDHMPTDLYYSGLNGSWDADGDGIFCERSSASGNPEMVDLEPDVFVGRAAVQTQAQAESFVSKVVSYEHNGNKNFQRKMLLVGPEVFSTYPNYSGYLHSPVSDAEVELDKLYDNVVAPYFTPKLSRFYDTFSSFDTAIAGDYELTPSHLEEVINGGYNFMTMYTHGGPNAWSMEAEGAFTTGNADNLVNLGSQGLIYTIACTTNQFDNFDPSLSEAFIRNPKGGAVAYMGSSRYGWWKTSNYFAEEFHKQLFAGKYYVLGQAFALHKQAKTSSSNNNGTYRWLQFSLNLLGDPTMEIWAPLPDFMLTANTSQTIDLHITNGDGSFQPALNVGDSNIGADYAEFAIADFDGDQQLDFIAATNEEPARLYLFIRTGTDSFDQRYLTTLDKDPKAAYYLNGGSDPLNAPDYGNGLISSDLDNDGDMDFIENVNHDFGANKYWLAKGNAYFNDGSGNFTMVKNVFDFTVIYNDWTLGMTSSLADVDGDGYPDLLASEQSSGSAVSSKVYLLKNNGNGTFGSPNQVFTTKNLPASYMTLGDFNNDGKVDALVGQDDDGDPGAAYFFKGLGNGSFEQVGQAAFDTRTDLETGDDQPGHGRFQAYDADFDGIMDVVSAVAFYGPVVGKPLDAELLFFRGKGDGSFESRQVIRSNILTQTAFTVPQTATLFLPVFGDLNGDRMINSKDYQLFRAALGSCQGADSYRVEADYDSDACISYVDYKIWYGYYRAQ